MADEKKQLSKEDQCAQECHDDWEACHEITPEDSSSCNTRLARCVKGCTQGK